MLRSRVSQSLPDEPPPAPGAPVVLPPAPDTLGDEVGTDDTDEGGGAAGGAIVPTLDKGLSPTFSLTKLVLLGGFDDESNKF